MVDPLGVDLWPLSPSGSRALDHCPEDNQNNTLSIYDVTTSSDRSANNAPQYPTAVTFATEDMDDMDDEDYAFANVYGTDLAPGQLMSTKVPPLWNGHGS